MKTYTTIYKIFKAMSLIAMTLVLANCGKSDNGGGSTTTTGYVLSNGQCLYNGTTTPLSSCQTVTTAGYGWANGQCYQVGAGAYTVTSTTYCASYPNYQLIGSQCYQITNGVQTAVAASLCVATTTTTGVTCQSQYGSGYNYSNGVAQTCSGLMYGAGGTPVVCAPTMTCGQITYVTNGYQQVTQMNCSGMTLSQSQWNTNGVYCQ